MREVSRYNKTMTSLEISLLVVDLMLWLAVVILKAIQPLRISLSEFELKRRAEAGDNVAAHERWRDGLLPRVDGLRWLVEAIVVVAAIALLFQVFGTFGASLAAVGAFILSDGLARTRSVAAFSNHLYRRREAGLLPRVERWRWLDWFRRPRPSQSIKLGSRDELAKLIQAAPPEVLSRDDRAMLTSELDFMGKVVADVMTPRSMIDTVDPDDTIGPLLLDRLHHTGHSRFPVVDGDVDHVIGTLYLHDLIGKKTAHSKVKGAMDETVYYIGGQRSLEHALHAFLRTHHHLFIVVNEYRETIGVLSLEDVVETLIGRSIIDEFDEFDDLRSVAEANPKSNNVPKGKQDI